MCYSNTAVISYVILLAIHLELSAIVEFQYSSELRHQPNSKTKCLNSTGLRQKPSYEMNHRPISGNKYQSSSEQHQPRSATND